MEPFAYGFCLVVGWIFGVWVGTKSERNAWKMRASNYNSGYIIAHHCDGEFYYVIEERYFNNTFSMKTKTSQEQKDERCEEELKGWVDK